MIVLFKSLAAHLVKFRGTLVGNNYLRGSGFEHKYLRRNDHYHVYITSPRVKNGKKIFFKIWTAFARFRIMSSGGMWY